MLTCFKTHIRENAPPVKPEALPGGEAIQLASASLPLEGATRETGGELATMPDFRGLAMRDVLSRARRQGIEIQVDGHGWAVHQEPAPGTPLADRRFCRVSFGTGQ
jgi:hypothetical protein